MWLDKSITNNIHVPTGAAEWQTIRSIEATWLVFARAMTLVDGIGNTLVECLSLSLLKNIN